MKTLSRILLPIGFSVWFILGCERGQFTNGLENEIIIGDYSNKIVNAYDTVLIGEIYTISNIDLDVNNDGSADIRLLMDGDTKSLDGLIYPIGQLLCLHNGISVLGFRQNDTVFRHSYTIDETVFDNYTCYNIQTPEDSSTVENIHTDQAKLEVLTSNCRLGRVGNFISDTITIIGQRSDKYVGRYTLRVIVDFSCEDLPLNKILYLGFKLNEGQVEKLGWIKMFLAEKNTLLIFESAIQI